MNHRAQRLLVAASRGARVELYESSTAWGGPRWVETDIVWLQNDDLLEDRRVHPDDAHLQYGPIATQLRLMAASTEHEWDETSIRYMADQYVYDFITSITWEERCTVADDRDHRPWQLLFAAELAADEGM